MSAAAAARFAIRPAEDRDLPAIAAIYDHEVRHTTATLETEPVTLDERRRWLAAHPPARYPVLVAEQDGAVVAWASLSPWSPRAGYARTAEISVYVDAGARRRGLGRALMLALEAAAPAAGIAIILSRVGGESGASLALHAVLGYRELCRMREVGEKHGRLLDIVLLERRVGEPR